jgi:hypothetical protein
MEGDKYVLDVYVKKLDNDFNIIAKARIDNLANSEHFNHLGDLTEDVEGLLEYMELSGYWSAGIKSLTKTYDKVTKKVTLHIVEDNYYDYNGLTTKERWLNHHLTYDARVRLDEPNNDIVIYLKYA